VSSSADSHCCATLLPPQGLFQYLDILLFVEATIYQMDEKMKPFAKAWQIRQKAVSAMLQLKNSRGHCQVWFSCVQKSHTVFT